MLLPFIYSLVIPYLLPTCSAACTPSSTSTDDLQSALKSGGEGYVLQLCAGETYSLQQTLNYTAANQVSPLTGPVICRLIVGNLNRGISDR